MSTVVIPLPSEEISQNQLQSKLGSENKCKFCGKLYSSPASLRTHEKWHTGDLKHKCSFCEKKFRNPSEVKRHEMTHTGEKPNKCPHCKMKFIQKTSLKDHIEKRHKGENPVANMEDSDNTDINLLELKDFSLQEYLNQSYDKVESLDETDNKSSSVPATSILSENCQVVTDSIPNNNNCATLEPKLGLSLQPQPLQSAKQFELLSVVDNDGLLSNTSPIHTKVTVPMSSGSNTSVNCYDLFDVKGEKLDDISIFFEELEGEYPTLRPQMDAVDTDGVAIKQDDKPETSPQVATVTFQAPPPPRYSDQPVVSLTPANPPPSYQEAVTLSSADAQIFQILPNNSTSTNQPSSSQTSNTQWLVQGQQQTATVSLSFQDELNEFCEGILNQIEGSDWNGINLEPGSNSLSGNVSVTFTASDNSISQLSLPTLDESSNLSSSSSQMLARTEPEPAPVDPEHHSWVTGRSSLPSGWKMRTVETNIGTRQIKKSHFLAPTGHYFDSRKSAIDHMIRTHSYSEDDIETMKKGLREKTKFDWTSTRTDIPKGWKTREKLSSDGKTRVFYLSPGGISFPCRLAAYEHMTKDGGYSIADIELMKIGAKNKRNKGNGKDFREGDPSLPVGWKIRINAQQKESFRSPHGVFYHSRQSVLDHLVQIGAQQQDIEKVKSKLVSKKSRRKKSSADFKWTEGDPSCPAGWKIRIVNCADGHSVTFFLTPEGTTIKGRKAALQHMLRTGLYSPEDVDLMKNHVNVISKVSDIWTAGDPTLPAGWKIKKYKSKSDSSRVHCEYLSPQNQVFRSRKSVIEHMRKVGGYTEQDVKIVEAGNVKLKQKSVGDFGVTGAVSSWRECDSLPKGWRLREEGEANQRKTVFLSPDGKVFWNRAQVLEAVKRAGASQEDINKVQRGMVGAPPGTITSQVLPQNRDLNLIQTQPSHSSPILSKAFTKPITVKGTEGQESITTLSSSIIIKNEPSESSQIKILEEKTVPTLKISCTTRPVSIGKPTILESKKPAARGSEIVWRVCQHQSLPAGWKTRTLYWTNREKHFFLSPEGKIFSSRKSVVEYMEQCGTYTEEDFEKVKKGLNKKKKKKMDNDQWMPGKRKQRKRVMKPSGSNNSTSLVGDNNAAADDESSESHNDHDEDFQEDTSDESKASIRPVRVRIEKF